MVKYIGTHVSAAGGVSVSPELARNRGATSFAFFITPPRTFATKELSTSEADLFIQRCEQHGFNRSAAVLPHGNYLINLASPKPETSRKGSLLFREELKRCNRLGITHYNLHPGCATAGTRTDAVARLTQAINLAHIDVPNVIVLLESMAGQGTTLGTTLDELVEIVSKISDKSRIGICLDTCHIFAAGQYDLTIRAEYDRMMSDLEEKGLLSFVKAFHLNDSKKGFASKLDRHENLGEGQIGYPLFTWLIQDDRLDGRMFITETPCVGKKCQDEIKDLLALI